MINGTHHAGICTDNMERLVAFYRDVMGFRVVAEGAWDVGNSDLDAVVGLPDSKARVTILWTVTVTWRSWSTRALFPVPSTPAAACATSG